MSEKSNKRGESAWVAEEIFEDPLTDLQNKCMVIDQQIADGVLDLDDALEVYGVSQEDYIAYFTQMQSALFESRFHNLPKKNYLLYKVKTLYSYFNNSFHDLSSDPSISSINIYMNHLENDVETDKVKLKR